MWTQNLLLSILSQTPDDATAFVQLFSGEKLPITVTDLQESSLYFHVQINGNKAATHRYVMYEQVAGVEICTNKESENA